ncbi:MAG: hypothetical protein AAF958_19355 [Planctomycetota bacterium]
MNQRERTLAMLVGGLVVIVTVVWGLRKYNAAVEQRDKKIANKGFELEQMYERQLLGEEANWQMGEYVLRSLPADPQVARRTYGAWLLDLSNRSGLNNVSVDPMPLRRGGDLLNEISFKVSGKARMPETLEWLHGFYAKDTLHRISNFKLVPSRSTKGQFDLKMTVDALCLTARPDDLADRQTQSFLLAGDLETYRDSILNRNLFEPPNQAPKYTGRKTLEAVAGRETTLPLTFTDPEKQTLVYELVDAPEDLPLSLDEDKGTLRVGKVDEGEFEIRVRVRDDGLPNRSVETNLVVKAELPPPPPPEAPEPLKFDDAKQTVLTALVQGKDEWTAWLHVRTRGETLRLRKGDGFEVGSVEGKLVEVTPRLIRIEVNGKVYEMKPADLLREVIPETADAEIADAKAADAETATEKVAAAKTTQTATEEAVAIADAGADTESDADADESKTTTTDAATGDPQPGELLQPDVSQPDVLQPGVLQPNGAPAKSPDDDDDADATKLTPVEP